MQIQRAINGFPQNLQDPTQPLPQSVFFFLLSPNPRGSRPADKPAPAPHSLCVVCAFRLHPWLRRGCHPALLFCAWKPRRTQSGLGPGQHPTPLHPLNTHTYFPRRTVWAKLFLKYFLRGCLSCRVVRSLQARHRFSVWARLLAQTHR